MCRGSLEFTEVIGMAPDCQKCGKSHVERLGMAHTNGIDVQEFEEPSRKIYSSMKEYKQEQKSVIKQIGLQRRKRNILN